MAAAIGRHPIGRVSMGLGALVLAGAVALVAFSHLHSSPRPLWPAKVPPAVGLCTEMLSYQPDGSVSPLFCPSGEINTRAWSYFAAQQLEVMALGPHVSPADVTTAVEQDLKARASPTTECGAAMLAAAYYGWNFHIQPTSGLRTDCPIQGQF
jgi:hypothetical protein